MVLSWFQRLFNQQQYPEVFKIRPLHGGDINQVFDVETSQGNYCIKVSEKVEDAAVFSTEKKSLNFLSDRAGVNVPQLYQTGVFEGYSFLMMTFIPQDSKEPSNSYWSYLANQVLQLHAVHADQFGLNFPTYIGPFEQDNSWKSIWTDFYIENRLEAQIKLAFDKKVLSSGLLKNFELFYKELPNLFPIEKPSLLHGDLWNGNVIKSADYRSFFIDPAIYFGHREMDLAMMKLFGGFDIVFYESYNDKMPLEKGWEDRIGYGQLYPLLVHLNLFGSSYLSSVEKIIKGF